MMMENRKIMGAILIVVRIFHQLTSHKIPYYVEAYMKKLLVIILRLKGIFMCTPLEDD